MSTKTRMKRKSEDSETIMSGNLPLFIKSSAQGGTHDGISRHTRSNTTLHHAITQIQHTSVHISSLPRADRFAARRVRRSMGTGCRVAQSRQNTRSSVEQQRSIQRTKTNKIGRSKHCFSHVGLKKKQGRNPHRAFAEPNLLPFGFCK